MINNKLSHESHMIPINTNEFNLNDIEIQSLLENAYIKYAANHIPNDLKALVDYVNLTLYKMSEIYNGKIKNISVDELMEILLYKSIAKYKLSNLLNMPINDIESSNLYFTKLSEFYLNDIINESDIIIQNINYSDTPIKNNIVLNISSKMITTLSTQYGQYVIINKSLFTVTALYATLYELQFKSI